jgi:HTH-type transcriptional regulator/antitoxin HigA
MPSPSIETGKALTSPLYWSGENGIKAKDLEPFIGSKGHVSAVLSGKREITLKMAQKLKSFLNIPAEVFFQGV